MATKAEYYAETEATRSTAGFINSTRVVRESREVKAGGGLTVGQMIDEYLHEQADQGNEVREVAFNFTEDFWLAYSQDIKR